MRLLLFGCGDFGLPTFEALAQHHDIVVVISQPDRPAGRKRVITPTPIAAWAQAHHLPVHKVDQVNTPQFIDIVRASRADASVVIAFGQKLPPQLIDAMGKLAINLHASLLPKYRGAGPINWAMIRGEHTTGVAVIGLAQQMDAGDVYARVSLPIDPNETAGELHDRLAALGPAVVQMVLDDLERAALKPQPQDHAQATTAPKLKKADGTVDFNQPAECVRARIHGLTPWPGCRVRQVTQQTNESHTLALLRAKDDPGASHDVAPGTLLNDYRVACASGTVQLLEVQPPGKPVMSADAFARGHAMHAGDQLLALHVG